MRQQLLSQLRTIGFLRVEGGGNPQQHDAPSWEVCVLVRVPDGWFS